jgi:aspartokinase-like uncharacterized kinase
VKVGGSLYDLPDLGRRLRRWLAELDTQLVLLVPGGGGTANVVRDLDNIHGIGEKSAHWLALRALSLNAHFLATLLPGAVVVAHPDHWRRDQLTVLDAYAFALADDGRAGSLPHSWSVTSDSIAARAACVANVRHLILLKSITIPEGVPWPEASRRGWVDAHFAEAAGNELQIRTVNLRAGG